MKEVRAIFRRRWIRRAAILMAVMLGAGCGLLGEYDFEGYGPKPAGAPELKGTFVGGAVHSKNAGIELTGQIVWHGSVKSTPNAAGIELEGWLR